VNRPLGTGVKRKKKKKKKKREVQCETKFRRGIEGLMEMRVLRYIPANPPTELFENRDLPVEGHVRPSTEM